MRDDELDRIDRDDPDMNGATAVPLPDDEPEAERERIRRSNDRDQALEREGKTAPHNRGYDEAADGVTPGPPIERITDEP